MTLRSPWEDMELAKTVQLVSKTLNRSLKTNILEQTSTYSCCNAIDVVADRIISVGLASEQAKEPSPTEQPVIHVPLQGAMPTTNIDNHSVLGGQQARTSNEPAAFMTRAGFEALLKKEKRKGLTQHLA